MSLNSLNELPRANGTRVASRPSRAVTAVRMVVCLVRVGYGAGGWLTTTMTTTMMVIFFYNPVPGNKNQAVDGRAPRWLLYHPPPQVPQDMLWFSARALTLSLVKEEHPSTTNPTCSSVVKKVAGHHSGRWGRTVEEGHRAAPWSLW